MSIGGKKFIFNYDDDPPSLRIDLDIASPNPRIKTISKVQKMLIDTGSDYTLIPNSVVQALKLKWTGDEIPITGFDDITSVPVKFYNAKVLIEGVYEGIMPVGGVDFEPVIGRDLINLLHTLINAPNSVFGVPQKLTISPEVWEIIDTADELNVEPYIMYRGRGGNKVLVNPIVQQEIEKRKSHVQSI